VTIYDSVAGVAPSDLSCGGTSSVALCAAASGSGGWVYAWE